MRLLQLLDATPGSWRSLFLTALLCSSTARAKKDGPEITLTKFSYAASELSYFDDSDVMLFQNFDEDTVYRSPDAGKTWVHVKDIPDGKGWTLIMHPFDKSRAYVLTKESTHYRTSDRGESWEKFFTDSQPDEYMRQPLSFHASDPDRIILNGQDCSLGLFCENLAVYTLDGFKSDAKLLRSDTSGCNWAKSTELFTTGQEDLDKNRILCISRGKYTPWKKDYRLLVSDNFFTAKGDDVQEFEPDLEPGRTVVGVSNMAVVKKYILAATSAEKTDEMVLYVTDDTLKWHRAIFPHDHKLVEAAYTVLESTNYSIQIDVLTTRPTNPMGVLLSSNSNGTYFTRNIEHTNRNQYGNVDFEKISGIQGIVLVNVVDNWEEVEKSNTKKKIKTQISYDDGRVFQDLKVGDEALQLHSITEATNSGRVFSSPAPGLVMGVGNVGDFLGAYADGNTYVSDNAGVTWTKALDGPHKYEFGDQGSILVAVKDVMTDKISYSINHGKTWTEVDLPQKVLPYLLTTTSDSSSLKFLLQANDGKKGGEWYLIPIDFDQIHERQCKEDDLEKWYARVDEKGDATCLMGHKQFYTRRKADADCFLLKEFQDAAAEYEICECTDADFECDYNFVRSEDRKSCSLAGSPIIPEGECKAEGDTFKGSSGWRLIPGDNCKRAEGAQKDDTVEHKCSDAPAAPPASGNIGVTKQTIKGQKILEKFYLERTKNSADNDETIIVQTDKHVFLSHDHGRSYTEIMKEAKVKYVIPHPYFNDAVYFLTTKNEVYYSMDRGDNIDKFGVKVPHEADFTLANPMSFHRTRKDWIIWTGKKCATGGGSCHGVSSVTTDRGDNWKTLDRYVSKCEFTYQEQTQLGDSKEKENMIFCKARTHESDSMTDNPWQLVTSVNFFGDHDTPMPKIEDFVTMSEYIIVAAKNEKSELTIDATVDGTIFAEALFPANFRVPHERTYTVLDSSTHSIFLHVTESSDEGMEYGSIIKSNSNGTSYVLTLSSVNRDASGYVDFEKMLGLEGVALANIVTAGDKSKNLKTVITHNDGSQWAPVPPPAKDSENKDFGCSGNLEKCSLHIHGYTERVFKSHTYSSPTAIGLMVGVGNVGEYLGPVKDADTYITTDAGINWKQARKGSYMWAYGDQGSIIVLVQDREATNIVYYSLNEGDTWIEYKFQEEKVVIGDISTLPSDNSRNFLLWTLVDKELTTINLDFTGLAGRQCKLDEVAENEDYYLWSPRHPTQDNDCLFGHISQFHRKKTAAECYNGLKIEHLHKIAENCECTRQDFECDYNFQALNDGACRLVPGLDPKDPSEQCRANPDLVEYWEPTGYRKIPLSTCEGGKEMEYTSEVHPCPGKEDEFKEKHGISGVALFFAIMIPIALATSVGWWVYSNWTNNFGQIRLGEQTMFDEESPFIKYPVMGISAIAALFIALPVVMSRLWLAANKLFGRGRNARYTTRRSFARDADYAAVDEDEGELLGEESDEEV